MMRSRLMIILALLVAGCADEGPGPAPMPPVTVAQPEQVEMAEYQGILSELRRASGCVTEVEARAEFASLRARTPKDSEPVKVAYFQDKRKASTKEKAAVDSFMKAISPCEPQLSGFALRQHRNIGRMISDTWRHQQMLYQQLRNGAITWGNFNQETKGNADKLAGGLEALRLTHEN